MDTIQSLIKNNIIKGINLGNNVTEFSCNLCEYTKAMRKNIKKERTAPLATTFGEEIHTDVWGPSPLNSLGGRSYYIMFTDDAMRYMKIRVLWMKDKALSTYQEFTAWAKMQHGAQIKHL